MELSKTACQLTAAWLYISGFSKTDQIVTTAEILHTVQTYQL